MDVIQKIADQIAFHRAELLRLESALEVIAEMGGKTAKAEKPLISVRKVSQVIDHEPKSPTRKRASLNTAKVREFILADLKANGPAKSKDIAKRLSIPKDDRKKYWQTLHDMTHNRRVIWRDAEGRYYLSTETETEPPEVNTGDVVAA
jgi:hypothetical protein